MNHLEELYRLRTNASRSIKRAIAENDINRQHQRQRSYDAISWAINRLDPRISPYKRTPANPKHYRNTKTYSITMAPEDHNRLVQLGKELHIEGGFSGVLTYLAQNGVLTHEKQ